MSKHEREPFRAVFDLSIDRLIRIFAEAQKYLDTGNDLAAIGSLHNLDELHEDVTAALRLFKRRRME